MMISLWQAFHRSIQFVHLFIVPWYFCRIFVPVFFFSSFFLCMETYDQAMILGREHWLSTTLTIIVFFWLVGVCVCVSNASELRVAGPTTGKWTLCRNFTYSWNWVRAKHEYFRKIASNDVFETVAGCSVCVCRCCEREYAFAFASRRRMK